MDAIDLYFTIARDREGRAIVLRELLENNVPIVGVWHCQTPTENVSTNGMLFKRISLTAIQLAV